MPDRSRQHRTAGDNLHGTNKLIGTEYANIPNEVQQAISVPVERSTRPELWDGKAAERIAEILRDNLIRNI